MSKKRLGELLIEKGLVSREAVEQALRLQVAGQRRLGHILLQMRLLSDEQLTAALAEQLDIPLVAPAVEFSPEVRRVLPRYLCLKYSVLPLRFEPNQVLVLAMLDPLDGEAITDVENYTGHAVRPVLANRRELAQATRRLVPLSAGDVWNPQNYRLVLKLLVLLTLLLLLGLGLSIHRQIQTTKYGTVTERNGETIFQNHDLMVGVDQSGRLSLLGRGAYAQGYFSVTFDDLASFRDFLQSKRQVFSDRQFHWLSWLMEEKLGG